MHDKPTDLYRHFNRQFRLLYVGISLNAWERARQHKSIAQWADEGFLMTVETHPNRAAALAAEAEAIRTEAPVYNIAGRARVEPTPALKAEPPPAPKVEPTKVKPRAAAEAPFRTYRDAAHRSLIIKQSRMFEKITDQWQLERWNSFVLEYAELRGDGMRVHRINTGRFRISNGIDRKFIRWLRAHFAAEHGFPELAEHSRGPDVLDRHQKTPPKRGLLRAASIESA
jgi:hypothetical protein